MVGTRVPESERGMECASAAASAQEYMNAVGLWLRQKQRIGRAPSRLEHGGCMQVHRRTMWALDRGHLCCGYLGGSMAEG